MINVAKPKDEWNGVKCMLTFQTKSISREWHSVSGVYGNSDWSTYSYLVDIPIDAEEGDFILGLQDSIGTVMFHNLVVSDVSRTKPNRNKSGFKEHSAYTGHGPNPLRGFMVSPNLSTNDLAAIHSLGANLIRFQLTQKWKSDCRDMSDFHKHLNELIDNLDSILPFCRDNSIYVVLDLHAVPGGRTPGGTLRMLKEPEYAKEFLLIWESLAKKYKDEPAIWAYDLVNEPVQGPPARGSNIRDYWELQTSVAESIRKIDPVKTIIFETDLYDSPTEFEYLLPVNVSNVVYQVHVYMPHSFTHQGVHGNAVPVSYPGMINGTLIDKEYLRRALLPVRDFQLSCNAHIYAGEFSAARWAPGADRYIDDVISLFEEYGWDWSYHAFREWHGWSLEHSDIKFDTRPAEAETSRMAVVKKWLHVKRGAE